MTALRREPLRAATLLLATALLALTALWATPAPAYACSCAAKTDAEYAQRADVIFTGAVISDQRYEQARAVTFAVQRVYKGQARSTETISTARWGGSCGPDLSETGPYLVYATQESSGLFANPCDGTNAGPAPASLGAGQPPLADPVAPSAERRGPPAFTGRWVPLVGLFLAATAAAIVGLSLIRREPE